MAKESNGNGKKDKPNADDGNPEFENFQQLLRQVLAAPKEKIDEQKAENTRRKQERQAG